MIVTYNQFARALEFLVEIEPEPELLAELAEKSGTGDDMAVYRELQAPYSARISEAHAIIQAYGEQIATKGLEHMQQQLYVLVNHNWSAKRQAVMVSTTNLLWNGLGQWQA